MWKSGGHYEQRGDFRAISDGELPVILHHMNKHDRKSGDKLEIIETGPLSLTRINEIQEDVFAMGAQHNRILRLDLAADVKDIPVPWFRKNILFKHKQTVRQFSSESVRGKSAETITGGQKPNQIRIYDKTGHRMALTMSALRRMSRDERVAAMQGDPKGYAIHFETMWGYDPSITVTRVERQLGGKTPEQSGIHLVGNLPRLQLLDPFTQLVFPGDITTYRPNRWTRKPEFRMACDFLRAMAERDGIDLARNYLRLNCTTANQFYTLWRRYAEFVAPPERNEVTRKALLGAFRESIHRQFKLAA